MLAVSDYDRWKLDGGWPYGDASEEERRGEEADDALDFESQWLTWNGKSSA